MVHYYYTAGSDTILRDQSVHEGHPYFCTYLLQKTQPNSTRGPINDINLNKEETTKKRTPLLTSLSEYLLKGIAETYLSKTAT